MGKRYSQLTNTADETDLVSGSYFGIDTSAGAKKLPAEIIPVLNKKSVNFGTSVSKYTQYLNGGTITDNGDGTYDVTRVAPQAGATNFVVVFNVVSYINANKKLVFFMKNPDYDSGVAYIDKLVLSTQAGNWNYSVHDFLETSEFALATKEGVFVEIDFSLIPDLDTVHNNYYLLVGSNCEYTSTATITFGVAEFPNNFVFPTFRNAIVEKSTRVGLNETILKTQQFLNNGTLTFNPTTGLYTMTRRSPGGSPSQILMTFNVNKFIKNRQKIVFVCRNPQYTDGAAFIDHFLLSDANGNWNPPHLIKNFLADNPFLFKSPNGYAVEIDFSQILGLDLDHNNYYIIAGSDLAYSASKPIELGLYVNPDIPVFSNFVGNIDAAKSGDSEDYITCWGDSLTQAGGWTTILATKSGKTVINAGIQSENTQSIMARQGGDGIIINNVTIPATTTSVKIGENTLPTFFGNDVSQVRQQLGYVNPVKIGDIEGTMLYDGDSHAYNFTRSSAGAAVNIDRPTIMRTCADWQYNSPYLMVIFMGQNGGWSTNDELIQQHEYMIAHAHAKNVLVLGLSSGTESSRADYESAMKEKFGRYFVSLREYLAHPIYDEDGVTITSCYGLADAGLTPTTADIDAIAVGSVPPQLLVDAVHYTDTCKTVIGNMLYKKCQELNIF